MMTTHTMPESWSGVEAGTEISRELYRRMMKGVPLLSLRTSPYLGYQVGLSIGSSIDEDGLAHPLYATFVTIDGRFFYAGPQRRGWCEWRIGS